MFAPGSSAASSPLFVEKGLLNAGLSRARAQLVIVATEKTMERMGAGGERDTARDPGRVIILM